MASGNYMPLITGWPHKRTSPRHQAVTQIVYIHIQASLWSGAPARTADTNTASGGITDHDGPLRKSNPESESFLILGFCCSPEPGDPMARRRFGGLGLCLYKLRLLYIVPWTQQGKDNMLTSALSLTCHPCHISCSASLHSTYALCFSTFSTCVS